MAFEKYTISEFINAWFNKDRSVMNDEEFETVKTEYVDAAGLFDEDSLSKIAYIHMVSNRVNSIELTVKLNKEFLDLFDQPYIPSLPFLKKFGHSLKWNKDKNDFLIQLDKVLKKESKYKAILEEKIKAIPQKEDDKNDEDEPSKGRPQFIRMLNSLGKSGYRIDKNSTTVEELAYMINQQMEESKILKNS